MDILPHTNENDNGILVHISLAHIPRQPRSCVKRLRGPSCKSIESRCHIHRSTHSHPLAFLIRRFCLLCGGERYWRPGCRETLWWRSFGRVRSTSSDWTWLEGVRSGRGVGAMSRRAEGLLPGVPGNITLRSAMGLVKAVVENPPSIFDATVTSELLLRDTLLLLDTVLWS